MSSDVVKKEVIAADPCTSCPSSKAMRVYRKTRKNGTIFHDASCFSCGHYEPNPPGYNETLKTESENSFNRLGVRDDIPIEITMQHPQSPQSIKTPLEEVLDTFKSYPIRALTARGLTKDAAEKYGVRVTLSPTDGETIVSHMYPYYKRNKLSGYKERIVATKTMFSKGDCRDASLFGKHCTHPNGKTLYITEGELDCLALFQILKSKSTIRGWEPSVVSLSHGSASAAKDIAQDLDFCNSFDKIVLVFDQDDAGERAVEDACKLLAGKVWIATFSEKDPNDMLLRGKGEDLKWNVLVHATQYMPDNIVNYADCWDRYKEGRNKKCYPWPESWTHMNEKTYGVRLGELVMITAGSGSGKTQFMRELKDHFHRTTPFNFADIALEEDIGDSIAGLVSLYLNKRVELPDVIVTPEEEREAFDFYTKERRWSGYDYFGGLNDDSLFSKIRFYAATGHKFIFLDHLSIIVSEYAADGGERERIDTIMTKLAKMVKELNITIFLIVHLRKTSQGTSFEEGAPPSLDDLRGSGTLKQLSWMVISISRNQLHEDKYCANTSELSVLKCRFTGRTGVADYLHFNDTTGRMVRVRKPDNYRPKRGGGGGSYRGDAF